MGQRNYKDGLWDVPFQLPNILQNTSNKHNKINYIIRQDKNKTELAQYLHACAFSPTKLLLPPVPPLPSLYNSALCPNSLQTWH